VSRELRKMFSLVVCLTNNLIINVCDVHAKSNVVAEKVSQDSLDNVETNICSILILELIVYSPCMAHVRMIVDCRSAHVPSDEVLVKMFRYE
jgi:hypothetical protein